MKVCLINPPAAFLIDQGVFPPLGLWYLQSALKVGGHQVQVIDLGLGDHIPNADVYGITGTTPQAGSMQDIIQDVQRNGARIVAGGAHATLYPEEVLSWGVDAVVKSEGEVGIFRALWEDGIIETPRMSGAELDALPLPNRDQTFRYNYALDGEPCSSVVTARGCPFNCAFCSHAVWGHKVSFRSSENVLKELTLLKGLGYNRVKFYDDTFLLNRPRLYRILDELKYLDMKWVCFCRANNTSREDLARMREAGCTEILVGVESGDQRILDGIQKGTTVKQNTRVVREAKEFGIRVKAFIITGLPGEDEESLERTKQWLIDNKPDHVGFTIYMPYRATTIVDHPENYDIHWQDVRAEETWITGRTEEAVSHVWTSRLSRERITEARKEVEAAYRAAMKEAS